METKKFERLMRRTEDPKLACFEAILDRLGVASRRNGFSRDAPILEVESGKGDYVWALLGITVGQITDTSLASPEVNAIRDEMGVEGVAHLKHTFNDLTQLDDIPDDEPCWPDVDYYPGFNEPPFGN
jgi:hypothetical protein